MNNRVPPVTSGPVADAAFQLVAAADGTCEARGALTFATASAAREQGLRILAEGRELVCDLRNVGTADSAGLAVLLDWLGAAQRAGRSLHYRNLPRGLMALARISEVAELLERGV